MTTDASLTLPGLRSGVGGANVGGDDGMLGGTWGGGDDGASTADAKTVCGAVPPRASADTAMYSGGMMGRALTPLEWPPCPIGGASASTSGSVCDAFKRRCGTAGGSDRGAGVGALSHRLLSTLAEPATPTINVDAVTGTLAHALADPRGGVGAVAILGTLTLAVVTSEYPTVVMLGVPISADDVCDGR